jgi:peptidoglycan/xylan/chitin deacetylase (PgdA/CDA1 family)
MNHQSTKSPSALFQPCLVAVATGTGPSNIVLTYDDGPEPTGTESVLSALADKGATATFFVLLSRTRLNPSIVGEILAQGHEIALHGVDHRPIDTMNPSEVFSRTRDAKNELEQMIGKEILWYRPPFGRWTPETISSVIRAGLTTVLWDVVLSDWIDEPDVMAFLKNPRNINSPGAIVLAHDNIASMIDGVEDVPATTFDRGELSRALIDLFHGKGFSCCSLEQALKTGTPIWKTQS